MATTGHENTVKSLRATPSVGQTQAWHSGRLRVKLQSDTGGYKWLRRSGDKEESQTQLQARSESQSKMSQSDVLSVRKSSESISGAESGCFAEATWANE